MNKKMFKCKIGESVIFSKIKQIQMCKVSDFFFYLRVRSKNEKSGEDIEYWYFFLFIILVIHFDIGHKKHHFFLCILKLLSAKQKSDGWGERRG